MSGSTVSIKVPNAAEAKAPVPLEQLEAEICELAGHLWAATARFLVLVEEFDRREGWAAWGMKSCAHWVSWKCGLGIVAAREHVRIARRLAELPLIREAFGRGELAYAKVRALCRVADTSDEAQLLDLARAATTVQLEMILRAWRLAKDDMTGRKRAQRHARRHVSWHYDEDGSVVLRARLEPEDGALVVAALEAAYTALQESAMEDPEPALDDARASSRSDARRADALVRVAQAALASDAVATGSDDRHLVVVHVDAATLTAEPDDGGRCHLEHGPGLAPETARRLACDAGLVVVTHDHAGHPLDVGRRTRAIPSALRRALRCRDGGCRAPGCTERRFVDGHHIRHWAKGGKTNLANLVLLCRRHHRMVHEGALQLAVTDPGSFRFSRPDGEPIPSAAPAFAASGPGLPHRHRRAGLTITAQTTQALGQGDAFDLGLTIDGLVATTAS
jgi:hypothetical protein